MWTRSNTSLAAPSVVEGCLSAEGPHSLGTPAFQVWLRRLAPSRNSRGANKQCLCHIACKTKSAQREVCELLHELLIERELLIEGGAKETRFRQPALWQGLNRPKRDGSTCGPAATLFMTIGQCQYHATNCVCWTSSEMARANTVVGSMTPAMICSATLEANSKVKTDPTPDLQAMGRHPRSMGSRPSWERPPTASCLSHP